MARLGWWVVAAVVVVVSACGGGGDNGTTRATEAPEGRTASFRGVTADAIKLGFVIINYDCIKDFVDFNRGDQQKIAQVFVDDVNANGGILGRKVVAVYKTYCPVGNAEALQVCTALTEDAKVFAVLGVFIDFSGDAQLCLARDHETIHIGHELKRAWIDEAPPGLLLTPDITAERRIEVLMNLVRREKFLDGKKVAVLADQENKPTVERVVEPALDDAGLAKGSTAVLTVTGTDTSAAQAQLDSFIEKWKGEGVDALVMVGLTVSSKQFVEKIKAAMPALQLLTDSPSGVGGAAQDAVAAGQRPNPYEGVVTADGPSDSERWKNKSALLQRCVDTYEKATGERVVGPDALKPGPDGKRAEIYIAVTDFCNELTMFKTIAEKVGTNLTNAAWTKAVDSFGPIKLVSADIASLRKGKYDAEDGFRLAAFDSSIGSKGDWKPLTAIEDASKAT
jgi:hypothetical protein